MKQSKIVIAWLCIGLGMQIFAAGTWPQWRGESRDGQVTDTPTWPDRLNADNLSQSWRIELGDGYSSPVVDLKRVYTVETKDKSREVVRAFDRASGQKIWEASWEGAMKVPFFARKNGSWVRSTPALYKGSLYVGGIRDVLVCIDAESGAINWTVDFKERHSTPGPAFGFVCSPLVDETGVYVQAGGGLVKVNCDTGAAIWRTLDDGGGMFGSAFSSPRFAHLYGKRQVLVQTRTTLAGVDPKTGSVLWKQEVPAFRGMNIIPPVPYGDAVFTSSYGGGTRMIDVAPAQNGQPWSATQRWQATLQGYMSSPIVIGKHVYWHLKNQRIACYNLETGEEAWRTSESFGKYMSMAVNGDRVLALDQGGDLFLMNLTPDALTVVDKFKVTKSDSWAHVATCGDEIFIREQRAIAAYRWRPLTDAPLGARAAE